MVNSTPKTRLDWIDRTKGIAILGIVLFHFFQNYPDRTNLVDFFNQAGAKFALAAVDLFFAIAGFNISYGIAKSRPLEPSLKDWKAWLLKRIYRLYPTYILAVFCTLLLYQLSGYTVRYFSLKFILSSIGVGGYLLQEINPGFWFFTVILQAYLFTPFLYKICQGDRKRLLLFGVFAGIFTKIICIYFEPGSSAYLYFLNTNFLGSYIFQFCLGLYWGSIYQERETLRRVDCLVSLICFVLGAIVYTGLTLRGTELVYMQGFDLVFTPFLFVLCWLGFNLASRLKSVASGLKKLSLFGVYSYPIYLLNQPLFFISLKPIARALSLTSNLKVLGSLSIFLSLLSLYTVAFICLEKTLSNTLGSLIMGERQA